MKLLSRKNAKQATSFCAVGFSNFIIDVSVYFTTFHWLHFSYITAQAVSYPCGAINSYFLNRRLTFTERGSINIWEVVRFAVLNVISIMISLLALFVAKHDVMLDIGWSKMVANGCVLCTNFVGSKWFVFKRGGFR